MNKVKINSDVELKDRLVAINRVTKVTKGGRTFTFAAIVVVGDGNGIIGWGLGKAGEVTAAIAKGVEAAKKNLVKVPVLKGTIPHEMEAHFGGAQVFLKPAAAGTGLVAGKADPESIAGEIERYFSDENIRTLCVNSIKIEKDRLSWKSFAKRLIEFSDNLYKL